MLRTSTKFCISHSQRSAKHIILVNHERQTYTSDHHATATNTRKRPCLPFTSLCPDLDQPSSHYVDRPMKSSSRAGYSSNTEHTYSFTDNLASAISLTNGLAYRTYVVVAYRRRGQSYRVTFVSLSKIFVKIVGASRTAPVVTLVIEENLIVSNSDIISSFVARDHDTLTDARKIPLFLILLPATGGEASRCYDCLCRYGSSAKLVKCCVKSILVRIRCGIFWETDTGSELGGQERDAHRKRGDLNDVYCLPCIPPMQTLAVKMEECHPTYTMHAISTML